MLIDILIGKNILGKLLTTLGNAAENKSLAV